MEEFQNQIWHLPPCFYNNLAELMENLRPQKMIAYCYGQKYSELICTIIPSKKGLKLGFYKGAVLPDQDNLLAGTGRVLVM